MIKAALAFGEGEIGYWLSDGLFYRAKNNGTVWTVRYRNWNQVLASLNIMFGEKEAG